MKILTQDRETKGIENIRQPSVRRSEEKKLQ